MSLRAGRASDQESITQQQMNSELPAGKLMRDVHPARVVLKAMIIFAILNLAFGALNFHRVSIGVVGCNEAEMRAANAKEKDKFFRGDELPTSGKAEPVASVKTVGAPTVAPVAVPAAPASNSSPGAGSQPVKIWRH